MTRPVILAVEGEPDAFSTIERELSERYGADYEIVCEASATSGLRALAQIKDRGGQVAVVLAALWMPDTTGPEFLMSAHALHPAAKRAVTVTWGERNAGEALQQAIALGQVDDWIAKPWVPGDEHFHQGVGTFLYEWARQHGPGFEAVRVVGEPWSARSHELRDFLSRNSILFSFTGVDTEEGRVLLERLGVEAAELPVAVTFDGLVMPNPSNAEIAASLGVNVRPQASGYDVTIIGAGPAGLAAAVYAASEGLHTLVLEREAIGGQASSSSLIRNYLGFPRGISGTELAIRAVQQAATFGAEFVYGQAIGVRAAGSDRVVALRDGTDVTSRAVIISTGVSYRRLGIPSLEVLIGSGVFYGAAASEAQATKGREVFVVGGANSAGQAAVHLAKHAARVTLLVRGSTLATTMSDYLIRQIAASPNIGVSHDTEVVGATGDGRLSRLVLRNRSSGATETVPAGALFILIGAQPHTSWLPSEIERDEWGYIVTGADMLRDGAPPPEWSGERQPLPFETTVPGVFAVGDVRHGSAKRVASSVGEGSVAIRLLHEYLAAAR
jgi:thioredoxin reductase (NADPH)